MHGAGILLLTAVAGYWVLERADTHKGELKRVGRLLGGLIIAVSFGGIVCSVWSAGHRKTGYCPMPMKKGGYCPFTSPSSTAPAESE